MERVERELIGGFRDHLPYGTSAGLTFIHFLDPALVEDVYADKPHAEVSSQSLQLSMNENSDNCG